ncbi:MAG: GldG family protein [Pseudobdellovibrionaceae bacterium]
MSRIGFILWIMVAVCLGALGITLLLLSTWVPFLWIPTLLAALLITGALYLDRKLYIEFLTMKTTKKGMNMGTMIILVVALVALINFLAVRNPKVWDLSSNKTHTLSPQSSALLKQLTSDLTVKFFYEKGNDESEAGRRQFTTLIRKYQDQSDKVKLEFVEVNESPAEVEKYGVREGRGVVFLDYEGRNSRVDKVDEQEVTSALTKVMRTDEKSVYFVEGHGELNTEEVKDTSGAYMAKQFLEGSRYKVAILNMTEKPIPEDASLVVIAGPRQEFLESEISMLREYLKKGGKLILAVSASGMSTKLEGLLNEIGLALKENFVVTTMQTPMGEAVNPQVTVANIFSPSSPITKVFTNSQMVLFRLPQGIEKIASPPEGIVYDEIVKTAANSVGFNNINFQGERNKGPFTVGMSAKGKFPGAGEGAKEMTVVVYGNRDFLGNQLILQNLNRDLYLNTVAFLTDAENLISITPRDVEVTQMVMTDTQAYVLFLGFLIPIPIIFFITALILWIKRRHA